VKTNAHHGGSPNGSGLKGSSMEEQEKTERLASRPHGGSLPATMNQGGSYSHANDHTIPQLMNQGPSDKRGNKTHVGVRTLMGQ